MQFVINSVSGPNANVTFTFDDKSTSTQNIDISLVNGANGNTVSVVTDFLSAYGTAYQAGLALQVQQAQDPALSALIGQTLISPS